MKPQEDALCGTYDPSSIPLLIVGAVDAQDSIGRILEDAARVRLFGEGDDDANTEVHALAPTISANGKELGLSRGTLVGRFLLLGKLGAGGMGVVYAAYDPELDRKVAIKLLLPEPRGDATISRARLLREAQALAKLSHQNVVTIYDVGTHDNQVWIAMEFVAGRTLRVWLEDAASWLEVMRVLTDVARGVAAAHAAGLVHRDLKPDNVMIGKDGRVRVMDFGLAHGRNLKTQEPQELIKSAERLIIDHGNNSQPVTIDEDSKIRPDFAALREFLTQAGAIQGTPAYMAPEQWRGRETNAGTDQYGWSVMAWEAMYGVRPFAGGTPIELVGAILSGQRKRPPTGSRVPTWLRQIIERGMAVDAANRWATMSALLMALDRGQTRSRMRTITAWSALSIIIAAIVVGYVAWARQVEMAQLRTEIDAQILHAKETFIRAEQMAEGAVAARQSAFVEFDNWEIYSGRVQWETFERKIGNAHALFRESIGELTLAFNRDPSLEVSREALLSVLYKHAAVMEDAGNQPAVDEIRERIRVYHSGRKDPLPWLSPAELTINTDGCQTTLTVERYSANAGTTYSLEPIERARFTGTQHLALEPGSYLLQASCEGKYSVSYPVLLMPGEKLHVDLHLPRQGDVPTGFAYIPPGRFVFGSLAAAEIRSSLTAEPARQIETGPYLIAKNEVTYGEYVEFLAAQTSSVRAALLAPTETVGNWDKGIGLSQSPDGEWRFSIPVGQLEQVATLGKKIDLASGAVVDWAQLPVAGLTWSDSQAYVAWLSATAKIPTARMCSEREWERAARGADHRRYPHGDALAVGDANYDTLESHRRPSINIVASYPISYSPFGVHDMTGSVLEWVSSGTHDPVNKVSLPSGSSDGVQIARGGSYMLDATTVSAIQRFLLPPDYREMKVGLRICADFRESH